MDWIDYKERLGIGFSDKQKEKHFITNMFNYFNNVNIIVGEKSYFEYCLEIGIKAKTDYYTSNYYGYIIEDLYNYTEDLKEFISRCIIFANILNEEETVNSRHDLLNIIKSQLQNSHIMYDVLVIDKRQFVFPKGVEAFDRALISDNLLWLKNYPKTEKAWGKALKRYSDIDDTNTSEVADLFRKALERFFQEFFKSSKSLENYIRKYGEYLNEKGVPKEISNELEKLLKMYTNYNNNYAKHEDKAEINVLEYIMYQTGNIIRLVITLSNSKDPSDNSQGI